MSTENEENVKIPDEVFDEVIKEKEEKLKKLSAECDRVFVLYQKAVYYGDKIFYSKRFDELNKAVSDCSMEIDAIKDYKKFNAFIQTDLGKEFLKLKKKELETKSNE